MNYIHTQTLEYPVSELQIRQDFPQTSFSIPFEPIAPYAVVSDSAKPSIDPASQKLVEGQPVKVGNVWQKTWNVVALPDAQIIQNYTDALTKYLDSVAQAKKYDDRITCAVRAGYPGPFQAEGQAFAAWMDAQNAKGYEIMGEVMSGARPLPTVVEFIGMLDPMVWP